MSSAAKALEKELDVLKRRMRRLRRDFNKLKQIRKSSPISVLQLSRRLNEINSWKYQHAWGHKKNMKFHQRVGHLDNTIKAVHRMHAKMKGVVYGYERLRKMFPKDFEVRGRKLFYMESTERQKLRKLLERDRRKKKIKD